MKKLSKKLLAVIMAVVFIFSIFGTTAVTASAATYTAFNQISSSKVMKTHTITTGNTTPYTNANMTTRGTENRPSKTAYIAGTDDLYVYKIGTNSRKVAYAYVSFPVGKTRYKAYIPLSTITSNNGNHAKTSATGKAYTYLRSNGTGGSSSMYIAKGDTVYLIATSGSYYQIMYNLSGNTAWRLAWITKSDYNKVCSGNKHTHNYATGYEAAHPHRVYKKCTICGSYYYTGETKKVSGCRTCYPSSTSFSPRTTAPASNNKYFYSNTNIFYRAGYSGQCTWYAYGRAYEILGKEPKLCTGNAKNWYSYNKTHGYYKYGSTPKVGAIVCWGNGTYGHVGVVEKVISNTNVYISEANVGGGKTFRYLNYNPTTWNANFQGYIYLI